MISLPVVTRPSIIAGVSIITVILLFARGMLRLWAPLIGVGIGTALAAWFGHLDASRVVAAPCIGIPGEGWPGLDLSFDANFWALLPAFALLSMVGCMETYADGISAQRMSHRKERPIDFRSVQGAINADGTGSIFAALLGTVPNTVFSTSLAVSEITGVASRRVGLWGGLFLVLGAWPVLGFTGAERKISSWLIWMSLRTRLTGKKKNHRKIEKSMSWIVATAAWERKNPMASSTKELTIAGATYATNSARSPMVR